MTKNRGRLALAAALAALCLALAACGQQAGDDSPGAHNKADVAFLHLMLHHHTQGIEMGKLAEHKGSMPEVKGLGRRIVSAQERENAEIRHLLEQLGAADEGPETPAVMKTVEEKEMKELEAAPPKEFDHLFLEHMTDHHLGAVELAEFELIAGKFPAVKHLAESIKKLQVKEAEEMQGLLPEPG